ncbi:HAD family acid phosphatase [Legionella sp.]|uniref:HAD family acid phosphatase n=1 Tax=Legionella sp. TaxID=459 RepID=UPI003CC59EB0
MKNFLLNKLTFMVLTLNTILFSAPIFSEPPNLTIVKNEVKNYYNSGLYQKELTKVIQNAQQFIVHQTIINQKQQPHKKLAIVLDIDETSLSNYKYMSKRDFSGTHEQIHHDIMNADSPAIQPMLALYKKALHHGVKVFFVSGRSQVALDATKKNLVSIGYTQWGGLYLRPDHYTNKSIIPFKSHIRELITQRGYTIIATIGDQYSDLKGGYAKKGFKLPNPYYYLP